MVKPVHNRTKINKTTGHGNIANVHRPNLIRPCNNPDGAADRDRLCAKAGFAITSHDPEAMGNAKEKLQNVEWCKSPYEAVKDCGIAVILTEWNEYHTLNRNEILQLMSGNILMDMRNIYKAEDIEHIDIENISIGRPLIH